MRQGPECKRPFKERLFHIFDDASNTVQISVV